MENDMQHESSKTGDEFTTRLGRPFIALRRRPPIEQPAGSQAGTLTGEIIVVDRR